MRRVMPVRALPVAGPMFVAACLLSTVALTAMQAIAGLLWMGSPDAHGATLAASAEGVLLPLSVAGTALLFSHLLASLLGAPRAWPRLATALVGWISMAVVLQLIQSALGTYSHSASAARLADGIGWAGWISAFLAASAAIIAIVQPARPSRVRWLTVPLISATVLILPFDRMPWFIEVVPIELDEWSRAAFDEADEASERDLALARAELADRFYTEAGRLGKALAQVEPGLPGQPDLFVVAVAADGAEATFDNEVRYLQKLAAARLGAGHRFVGLSNRLTTDRRFPLATAAALAQALQTVADRSDPAEDIVLIVLTSHGSQDHELSTRGEAFELPRLTSSSIALAIEEAGIGPHVVVISACYSGGFIGRLAGPDAVLITAAASDRPSFGCGPQSEISWFGQALLVEALNETLDLEAAFDLARRAIEQRELIDRHAPSRPQLRLGEDALAAWNRWREAQPQSLARVPFEPAERLPLPPADDSSEDRDSQPTGAVDER